MDPFQNSIEIISQQLSQIKWILVIFLAISTCILVGIFIIIYKATKYDKEQQYSSEKFRKRVSLLLDQDDLDQVIALASERLKTHPKDSFARWYLARAYFRRKEWKMALREFDALYEIEPTWREEYINSYITDIKEEMKNFKPEIVKD